MTYLRPLTLSLITATCLATPVWAQNTAPTAPAAIDSNTLYMSAYKALYDENDQIKENPDVITALPLIQKADAAGHDEAPALLGLYYEGAFGTDTEPGKVKAAFARSAQRGSSIGQLSYGVRYYDSKDMTEAKRALGYLEALSADEMYKMLYAAQLTSALTEVYSFGTQATAIDLPRGRRYAWQCTQADPENAECQYMFAQYLKNGWGGVVENNLSTQAYANAADLGDARAQWEYGIALIEGRGVTRNDEEAYTWIKMSAESGHLNGLISYATMNAIGEGTSINYDAAFEAYERAARLGSLHGIRAIGAMHLEGQGRPPNQELGTAALLIAHAGGDSVATQLLGELDIRTEVEIKRAENALKAEMTQLRTQYGFSQKV